MSKHKGQLFLGFAKLSFFIAVAVALVLSTVLLSKWMRDEASKEELAKVTLALNDVDLKTVHAGTKDIKYPGNYVTVVENGELTEYLDVELKGRGNSTWGWEKAPYQFKLSEKEEFLGMGAAKTWIFLANYFDMSNLRTSAAFKLESLLDQDFALSGHFAELTIDDDWRGLYFVTEKIGVGKTRINLKDKDGVVVELENAHAETEECYFTNDKTCFVIKDSVDEDNEDEAMKKFITAFNNLEEAVKERDYDEIKGLIDVESLAKYYLLSEFSENPDAYDSSWYFYKDGEDDKIHVGPGWDFDNAFGNHIWTYGFSEQYYSPEIDALEIKTVGGEVYDEELDKVVEVPSDIEASKMIYYLLEIPEFAELVKSTYLTNLYGKKSEMLLHLMVEAGRIREAAIEDNAKYADGRDAFWQELGAEIYNGFDNENFDVAPALVVDSEVDYLLDWVSRRFDYLDKKYTSSRDIMVM